MELADIAEFAGLSLAPWDAPYWLEKLKQKRYSVSNEELRKYFPVDTVIEVVATSSALTGLANVPGPCRSCRVRVRAHRDFSFAA